MHVCPDLQPNTETGTKDRCDGHLFPYLQVCPPAPCWLLRLPWAPVLTWFPSSPWGSHQSIRCGFSRPYRQRLPPSSAWSRQARARGQRAARAGLVWGGGREPEGLSVSRSLREASPLHVTQWHPRTRPVPRAEPRNQAQALPWKDQAAPVELTGSLGSPQQSTLCSWPAASCSWPTEAFPHPTRGH